MLVATIAILGLFVISSGMPIASPALDDGTVNVARADLPPNDATFEPVDESSQFSLAKRAVPIEHMNDLAVGKSVANDKVVDSGDLRKQSTRAALGSNEGEDSEVVRRLAQHTGVQ